MGPKVFKLDRGTLYDKGLFSHDTVMHALGDKRIDVATAIDRLERSGTKGLLHAGQLCVEEAMRDNEGSLSLDWFSRAETNFQRVKKLDAFTPKDLPLVGRSAYELLQLPLHMAKSMTGKLPNRNLVQGCYNSTVSEALILLNQFGELAIRDKIAGKFSKESGDMIGLLWEMSLLIIGQRLALQEIGPETWNIFPSTYLQDNRNRIGSSISHGWDLSIVTDGLNGLDLTHRIEARSSDKYERPPSEARITTINRKQMGLDNKEASVGDIIKEAWLEIFSPIPERREFASSRLRLRTEKFLDIIDE